MLLELNVKNFAIIDDLSIPFSRGLNILTGETGAGKSIIVSAIGLILGERCDADLIRSGADSASVSAIFDLSNVSEGIISRLNEDGLDLKEGLLVKRVVSKTGKNRAYINDQPVSLQFLRELAPHLVDISSQNSQQILLDPQNHLSIIDQFCGLGTLKSTYSELYSDYLKKRDDCLCLENSKGTAGERASFLEFQLKEIKSVNIKVGEDEALERERKLIRHAAMLLENLSRSEGLLYSDSGSIGEQIGLASNLLKRSAEADESLSPLVEDLEVARLHIEDVYGKITRYKNSLSVDPSRGEFIEERLHLLNQLKKKYGGSLEAVLKKGKEIAAELDLVENYDERLLEAKTQLEKAVEKLKAAALKLSLERKKDALLLSKAVQKEFEALDFKRTTFHVELSKLSDGEFGPNGIDNAEFVFAPNVGEPLMGLAKIASGGELSRVTLAIKQVLGSGVDLASTFVFDEVDSGIGGRTAEVVGRKLKTLSKNRQVVCITHLPQIACFADFHYRISKIVKGGRTVTRFDAIEGDDRIGEIARMLGGINISKTTLTHAREMLSSASGL